MTTIDNLLPDILTKKIIRNDNNNLKDKYNSVIKEPNILQIENIKNKNIEKKGKKSNFISAFGKLINKSEVNLELKINFQNYLNKLNDISTREIGFNQCKQLIDKYNSIKYIEIFASILINSSLNIKGKQHISKGCKEYNILLLGYVSTKYPLDSKFTDSFIKSIIKSLLNYSVEKSFEVHKSISVSYNELFKLYINKINNTTENIINKDNCNYLSIINSLNSLFFNKLYDISSSQTLEIEKISTSNINASSTCFSLILNDLASLIINILNNNEVNNQQGLNDVKTYNINILNILKDQLYSIFLKTSDIIIKLNGKIYNKYIYLVLSCILEYCDIHILLFDNKTNVVIVNRLFNYLNCLLRLNNVSLSETKIVVCNIYYSLFIKLNKNDNKLVNRVKNIVSNKELINSIINEDVYKDILSSLIYCSKDRCNKVKELSKEVLLIIKNNIETNNIKKNSSTSSEIIQSSGKNIQTSSKLNTFRTISKYRKHTSISTKDKNNINNLNQYSNIDYFNKGISNIIKKRNLIDRSKSNNKNRPLTSLEKNNSILNDLVGKNIITVNSILKNNNCTPTKKDIDNSSQGFREFIKFKKNIKKNSSSNNNNNNNKPINVYKNLISNMISSQNICSDNNAFKDFNNIVKSKTKAQEQQSVSISDNSDVVYFKKESKIKRYKKTESIKKSINNSKLNKKSNSIKTHSKDIISQCLNNDSLEESEQLKLITSNYSNKHKEDNINVYNSLKSIIKKEINLFKDKSKKFENSICCVLNNIDKRVLYNKERINKYKIDYNVKLLKNNNTNSLSNVKEKHNLSYLWIKVLKLIEKKEYNNAFKLLTTKILDDIYFIRFCIVAKNNNFIDKLNLENACFLIKKMICFKDLKFINKHFLNIISCYFNIFNIDLFDKSFVFKLKSIRNKEIKDQNISKIKIKNEINLLLINAVKDGTLSQNKYDKNYAYLFEEKNKHIKNNIIDQCKLDINNNNNNNYKTNNIFSMDVSIENKNASILHSNSNSIYLSNENIEVNESTNYKKCDLIKTSKNIVSSNFKLTNTNLECDFNKGNSVNISNYFIEDDTDNYLLETLSNLNDNKNKIINKKLNKDKFIDENSKDITNKSKNIINKKNIISIKNSINQNNHSCFVPIKEDELCKILDLLTIYTESNDNNSLIALELYCKIMKSLEN